MIEEVTFSPICIGQDNLFYLQATDDSGGLINLTGYVAEFVCRATPSSKVIFSLGLSNGVDFGIYPVTLAGEAPSNYNIKITISSSKTLMLRSLEIDKAYVGLRIINAGGIAKQLIRVALLPIQKAIAPP